MSKMEKLDEIEFNVRRLLEDDERCRNDDTYLILRYVNEINKVKMTILLDQLDKVTVFESITRCRRKLQAAGMWQATDPKVRERREANRKKFHDYSQK